MKLPSLSPAKTRPDGGGEHAGHARRRIRELPPALAGDGVDGAQRARRLLGIALHHAAERRLAGHQLGRLRLIGGAGLARGDEEEAERGVERRRHEVGAAPLIGHARALAVVQHDRTSVGVELARPRRGGERLAEQQSAGHAVEHVEEAVAVGHHHHLARRAPPIVRSASTGTWFASQSCVSCGVNWKCHFRVPVSASSASERGRVEVVALAVGAVVVGVGIAGAPVERVQLRIVGAGHPRGAAAARDRVRAGRPASRCRARPAAGIV